MTQPPAELIKFLYRHDPSIQSLALGLRKVVLEEMAPCHEYIFAMRSKVVLLYSATERVIEDCVCSVNVFTRHVNLAFHQGTDLKDAQGILKGTGKAMRHISLKQPSDLDRTELRDYLGQARRCAGITRLRPPVASDVVTRVKPKSSKTRPAWPQAPW